MSRTRFRLAAAVLAGLLLSGCGEVQGRAGAAAVVGDERISTSVLEEMVERGLSNAQAAQQFGGDQLGYQTQILSRLVRGELLEEAARDLGVTVTQGDVDVQLQSLSEQVGSRTELERQAAAVGIAPQDLPRRSREAVLEQEIADALTADIQVPPAELQAIYNANLARFDSARTAHILVQDETLARTLLAQVQADPSRFAALAAEHSLDEANAGNGGELGLQGRGTFVPEYEAAVFAAQPGQFILAQTSFGWHVIHVQERQTTPFAEAVPELRRIALDAEREERVDDLLRETAEEVGVAVNPRFGRWDAEQAAVVARPEAGGPVQPAPEDGAADEPAGEETADAPAGEPTG